MPYQWLPPQDGTRRLHLWPYRSLPRQGFVIFISATAALIALPLVTVLGSPVMWALLPFLLMAVAAIWWALMQSYRDGQIIEDLVLEPAIIRLTRHGPGKLRQDWEANPYWVRVELYRDGGPVPNYVTLKGGSREVEIGAFLSEDERIVLAKELDRRLQDLRKGRE